MAEQHYLTRRQELALALTCAAVVANAYYIHPIISQVADHFGVSEARIGIVPALNQLALAIGIFFLLPLGDRYSNRTLTLVFVAAQTVSLLVMTVSQSFTLFVLGSTVLGFFTIAPYILPAYASKRVAPERLGYVTAQLSAGVIFGILVARVGSGVVTEYFGWRAVYWFASAVMLATALTLPFLLEGRRDKQPPQGSYSDLIRSLLTLATHHKATVVSAVIQALNFACFLALWLALALHLTSPEMGYGVDMVGYLAGIGAISILSTPRLGQWADKVGPYKARVTFAAVQFVGMLMLWPFGWSLALLVIPLLTINFVGPAIDVAGRMTFLGLEPSLRTRLTTIYIVLMFIGGGLGSVLGTAVYDYGGWNATAAMLLTASATILAISVWSKRKLD